MSEKTLSTNTSLSLTQEHAISVLEDANQLIRKSYLSEINKFEVINVKPQDKFNLDTDVRIFKIERIVIENKQSVIESMTASYNALGAAGFAVFILLKSDGEETTLYLGVRGEKGAFQGSIAGKLLQQTFKGNFSGSELTTLDGDKVKSLINGFYHENNDGTSKIQSVTSVTGVPALSTDNPDHFMQGLEKFIDAAEGQQYSALILAEPVKPKVLNIARSGYEQVYTQLYPLLNKQYSYSENQSEALSTALTQNISESLSNSLTQTKTSGTSKNRSESSTHTEGSSTTKSNSSGFNLSQTSSISNSLTKGRALGAGGSLIFVNSNFAKTTAKAIGQAVGSSIGLNSGYTHSKTESVSNSTTRGVSEGKSNSTGLSTSESKTRTMGSSSTESDTKSIGSAQQYTMSFVDKSVEQLLGHVDKQLQRVEDATRYGGWETSAYFIGESSPSTKALASIFLGLMRGQKSESEDFLITNWDKSDSTQMKSVIQWLKNINHPRLVPNTFNTLNLEFVTPTTLVSGKEMAIQLSLPRKSTSGTAVLETQSFGRQVTSLDTGEVNKDGSIRLGVIRHLWHDLPQSVNLNINNLTSHLFVSGSTGSGKSNTVYGILSQLKDRGIPFLVVEPSKGEYKHVFGNDEGIKVFSTNPAYSELLKINPFKFPESIHVLEHIDRLVEIFNVCWPMYAAMPAVLKEAILEAYISCGWDIDRSINSISSDLFPSFTDLLFSINHVIKQSAYSEEVKSNYIGSLATRIKSLTNGLNGQIFDANEVSMDLLFKSNVIIDLSRVGSQETKSLIMGIIIMRLSEYHMAFSGMNEPLRHVTVLEEAHNILKRTSLNQSVEGSNVTGKAVEMLSNSIAEMRTYGEGFIICDQSPMAVDHSAIRNTNTKIIMRLPDEQDRRIIGKAAGVTNEQLDEMARLPRGVAVVYQNDWLEPVLCKIEHFNLETGVYNYCTTSLVDTEKQRKEFNLHLARLILHNKLNTTEKFNLQLLKKDANKYNMPTKYKVALLKTIEQIESYGSAAIWSNNVNSLNLLLSVLGIRETVRAQLNHIASIEELRLFVETLLNSHLLEVSDSLIQCITVELQSILNNRSGDKTA